LRSGAVSHLDTTGEFSQTATDASSGAELE
jgi:hypothetical protein